MKLLLHLLTLLHGPSATSRDVHDLVAIEGNVLQNSANGYPTDRNGQ